MTLLPETQVVPTTAAEFCRHYDIRSKPPAAALLAPELSPQQYFDRLVPEGHYREARRILAHFLPKPRALWWACLCTLQAYRSGPQPGGEGVLRAVSDFVIAPTEAKRYALEKLGKEAGFTTLPGCLAMAAFSSGGSLAPPGLYHVVPKPHVTGHLVSVTVYLAAVWKNTRYKPRLRDFLALGVEVARGNYLWTEPAPPPVPEEGRGDEEQHLAAGAASAGG